MVCVKFFFVSLLVIALAHIAVSFDWWSMVAIFVVVFITNVIHREESGANEIERQQQEWLDDFRARHNNN